MKKAAIALSNLINALSRRAPTSSLPTQKCCPRSTLVMEPALLWFAAMGRGYTTRHQVG
jgi:hypothetical protein